jgi:hypothetical protein
LGRNRILGGFDVRFFWDLGFSAKLRAIHGARRPLKVVVTIGTRITWNWGLIKN